MKINFDRFGPCLAKIAARGKLNEQEARDILAEVGNRAEQMRRSGIADPFVTAAKALADRLTGDAKADLRDALNNARIRNFDKGNIQQLVRETGKVDVAADFLQSKLVEMNRPMAGTEAPVESKISSLQLRMQSEIDSGLREINSFKAVSGSRGDPLGKDVAIAIFKAHGMGPKLPSATLAERIADVFMGPLDKLSARLQAAGARFTDAIDYVTHTSHSPRQMIAAGFDRWRQFIETRASEYTYRDLVPRERESMAQAKTRFWQSIYNALITGVHMGSPHLLADGDGYIPPAFEGTHNLASRFSHARVIHFKDGAGWYEYMREFGDMTSLYSTIHSTIHTGASAVSLMESFGTNPRAQLNQLTRWVQENWRDTNPHGVIRFTDRIAGIHAIMDQLDGTASRPANEAAAQISRLATVIRLVTGPISKLGNVGETHFNSIMPTSVAVAPHYGISRIEQIGNVLRNVVNQAVGTAERQEILDEAGAFTHGQFAHFWAHMYKATGDNGLYRALGITSSLAAMELRATGINFVMESGRNGFMYVLMSKLGRAADGEWRTLQPNLQSTLGHYGIGRLEWDMMRATSPGMHTVEGIRYMTPKDLERIPDADIEGYLRSKGMIDRGAPPEVVAREIAKGRWALQDAYGAFLDYAGRTAVITAGARERAWALHNTQPGTLGGEVMRMVMTFKYWPMAVMNQIWLREIYSSHSRMEKFQTLGLFVAMATAFGYLRMMGRDVANGDPPRDPRDPHTMMGAFAQGGGLGIYGDFAFGEVNRMGRNFTSTLAGPAFGDVAEVADLFFRFRDDTANYAAGKQAHRGGAYADFWPGLARLGVHHIPFVNVFGVKGAMDYLLFNSLYEALSPGWRQRTERRLIRDTGRGKLWQ